MILRLLPLLLFSLFCCAPHSAWAEYTLLLPDQPTQEWSTKENKKNMDVLLALADPFALRGVDMEMPQLFAVVRHVPLNEEEQLAEEQASGKKMTIKALREELLGELEEIRYLDKVAWAAHVSLETPGLYQLITETRPRWDEVRGVFEQQFVKTVLPVFGMERGWDAAAGLALEVTPRVRPFGLLAPAYFAGCALRNGEPLANAMVRISRINTDKKGLPGPWHTEQVVKTDAQGNFAFVCPLPGWWGFMVSSLGAPMKGSDGQPKNLEANALLWVYVDDAKSQVYKPQKNR